MVLLSTKNTIFARLSSLLIGKKTWIEKRHF